MPAVPALRMSVEICRHGRTCLVGKRSAQGVGQPDERAERIGAGSIVEYLLARGATDNRTPADYLIGACWREDEKAVRALLPVKLLPRDHGNVATAARSGRLKVVELMLDAGFNIEARADDLDATPLGYAATTGDAPMVRLLLARGAQQGISNKYGGTPVDAAVYCAAHFNSGRGNYVQVVRALLAAGGEVPPHSLELALEYHLDEIAGVLEEYGA